MSNPVIRAYQASDQPAVARLLAQCLVYDDLNERVFADRVLSDPDFDPELNLVGSLNGQGVGFAAGAPGNPRLQCPAGIKLFAVAPAERRSGVATRLFDELEGRLRATGAAECVAIGAGNNRLAQGLDVRYTPALCFLLGRAYTPLGATQDMAVDLANIELDPITGAAAAMPDVRFWRCTADDREWLQDGIERELEYPAPGDARGRRWAYLAQLGLDHQPPSVHVAAEASTGAFLGFAVNHAARWGALGPMGVAERARGRGVGATLLRRCLADLRSAGYEQGEVYSVGPIAFYSKAVGATISRVYYRLAKPL